MRFDNTNIDRPAPVADIEAGKRLEHVTSVDTTTGEVECFYVPLRVAEDGESIATYKLRFRAIYPIYGGRFSPCAFHCYGPQPTA